MSGIKLTMYLSYGPQREMTVAYAPGGQTCYSDRSRTIEQKPMLKICNRFLLDANFRVGDKVGVEYAENIITVRKLQNHEHNNLQVSPISNPAEELSAATIAA